MKKELEAIRERLEANSKFKDLSKEIGLTFEDFKITDSKTQSVIKEGRTDKGVFSILVKEDNKLSVIYDLVA